MLQFFDFVIVLLDLCQPSNIDLLSDFQYHRLTFTVTMAASAQSNSREEHTPPQVQNAKQMPSGLAANVFLPAASR